MRIVVATYEGAFSNQITQALLAGRPGSVVGVLRSRSVLAGRTLGGSAWRIARRGGAAYAGLKLLESRRLRGWAPPLESLCADSGVPMVDVKDVNAAPVLGRLRRWRPELVVSIYLNHRIRKPLLAIPSLGVLNVHGSLLPARRGLFPAFWALLAGDRELGSTVHWVDEDFDTGPLLVQRRFPIRSGDTVVDLQQRSAEAGAALLLESLDRIGAGDAPCRPQDPDAGTTHSWPTTAEVVRFYLRGRRYGLVSAQR